jgi:nitronate monooxygenase
MRWPDDRIRALFGIDVPILLAPMAGPGRAPLAIAVAQAGGLGSLPCALLSPERIGAELTAIRDATVRPINLNFFCHAPATADPARETAWRARLRPYYAELGLDPDTPGLPSDRPSFDDTGCAIVERWRPEIVSFHFGLPAPGLVDRVKATGAKIIASATTPAEARWLEARGCDAIIAQGGEAGGHSCHFLSDGIATRIGTIALVPQIVDAVRVPVIAAGGIADARGIAAAFALGASAVQIGTAFLRCPEAQLPPLHRAALENASADQTMLTNVFTGRPARGIANRLMCEVGPIAEDAPAFPLAGGAVAPLRARTEPAGSPDFMPLWAGQAFPLGGTRPAAALVETLAAETLALLARLSAGSTKG